MLAYARIHSFRSSQHQQFGGAPLRHEYTRTTAATATATAAAAATTATATAINPYQLMDIDGVIPHKLHGHLQNPISPPATLEQPRRHLRRALLVSFYKSRNPATCYGFQRGLITGRQPNEGEWDRTCDIVKPNQWRTGESQDDRPEGSLCWTRLVGTAKQGGPVATHLRRLW